MLERPETEVLVRARGLTKKFGSFTAVDGIDFDLYRGEAFGFLGPNGAGKSSTMRMIGCVSPPTSGELSILGRDPVRDGSAIRARLGVVPQEDTLDMELTVRENLLVYGRYFGLPRRVIRERTAALLDFVQLADRAESKVDPLSGGLKRRLTIARSLINEPEILILDEPTTGLDPQARHVVWDRLFRLKQRGVTLILTTHYMDEAEQLCDRLVVMDHGRFAAAGSPRDLIARHCSPEVLEVRFDPEVHDVAADKLKDFSAERTEVLADRILFYVADGDAALAAVRCQRPGAAHLAGPPRHARGRVPAADRAEAGGLVAPASLALPSSAPSWSLSFRAFQCWLTVYRRIWRSSIWSSVLGPICYIGALGFGLGTLVDKHGTASLGGVSYLAFVAPAILASGAMNTAMGEASFPVFGSLKWNRIYIGAQASPLRPADIFRGHLMFMAMRIAMNCAVVMLVMWAFGAIRSAWVVLAYPAAVLTGLAFATPIAAWAVTVKIESSFTYIFRFVMMPLMLFSGTFFPISQLPAGLRLLAYVTPLWQGVALCRAFSLGTAASDPVAMLGHVAYLAVLAAVGTWAGARTYRRRLYV